MWAGEPADGERALAGLRGLGEPIADFFGAMPYADFQCMLDDPPGYRNYWTAEQADDLPDALIDAIVERCAGNGPRARRSSSSSAGAASDCADRRRALSAGRARRALRRAPALAVGGPGRRRAGDRLVARLPRADGALPHRRLVPELPRRRGEPTGCARRSAPSATPGWRA